MVELRDITFENVNKIIKLKRKFSQRKFVEKAADTISFAYAGINDGYPGFASAIYSDGEPVGFLIDKHFQHKGIGREALKLAFEKVKEYPEGNSLPIPLECYKKNRNAMKLYESFGFYNTGIECRKQYIFVRLPEMNR